MAQLLVNRPSCIGFNSQRSQFFFRGEIIDFADVNQWPWLEESGQQLKNVDQTNLVLANGKSVLQKMFLKSLGVNS